MLLVICHAREIICDFYGNLLCPAATAPVGVYKLCCVHVGNDRLCVCARGNCFAETWII